MEGTQFYGLFGMVFHSIVKTSSQASAKCSVTHLRDESNHIELFRNLFMDLVEENEDVWTESFRQDLEILMAEAVS